MSFTGFDIVCFFFFVFASFASSRLCMVSCLSLTLLSGLILWKFKSEPIRGNMWKTECCPPALSLTLSLFLLHMWIRPFNLDILPPSSGQLYKYIPSCIPILTELVASHRQMKTEAVREYHNICAGLSLGLLGRQPAFALLEGISWHLNGIVFTGCQLALSMSRLWFPLPLHLLPFVSVSVCCNWNLICFLVVCHQRIHNIIKYQEKLVYYTILAALDSNRNWFDSDS